MTSRNLEELISRYNHIQVCSYDAGGGNVLAHLINGLGINATYIIGGPSVEIYSARFPNLSTHNSKTLNAETDLLISSTGWQSTYEFEVMKSALERGIPVIAVMDHWVNYVERFKRAGESITPTYFLAFDDTSEDRIRERFRDPRILRSKNYYLEDVRRELEMLTSKSCGEWKYDILFISEPLSRHQQYSDWDEHDALQLLSNTLSESELINLRVAIKLHPTEISEKYTYLTEKEFPNLSILADIRLEECLSSSKIITGCHSMALYVAYYCNKEVLACLPPGKSPMIPGIQIRNIKSLSEILQ